MPVLRPDPRLDPDVRKKILQLRLIGLPCVLGLFLLAVLSSLGYLPGWLFWTALGVEAVVGPYLLYKVSALRKTARRN